MMAIRPITTRWKVLGGSLALTLMATGWLAAGDDASPARAGAGVRPAPRPAMITLPAPAHAAADAAVDIRLERLRRQRNGETVGDAFTAHSWHVAPPPAPVSEPPAAPAPEPEVPVQALVYSGKMLAEGKVRVFITVQGRAMVVEEGNVVDGLYRIDSIKAPLMEWTYLPLDRKQTMHIGEHN
jgi:hypothetical protein